MVQKDGRRRAFTNARLLDPAGGLDTPGALLVDDGLIADLGADLFADGVPEDAEIIDCRGHGLCPGLIDMRAFLGEPGAEHKETIATASQAAAAGGVTTMIAMPDTHPVIDDAALVEFIKRRAQETAIVRIHPMAAITKGLKGTEMTEMGLLADAGAVGLTDGETHHRRCAAHAPCPQLCVELRPPHHAPCRGTRSRQGWLHERG